MTLATMLVEIRRKHRYATADDIRKVFGDYHNLLRWLTGFLVGDEKLADACIVDACTIAETQSPDFHEWLVHWGARATVGCALCRFVLVLRGFANDSYEKVAAQLGISCSAVEGAYCFAFDALEPSSDGVLCSADVPARHINKERTLADLTA